jgi:tetratricopeptide (TPR) repeat protein/tRNA A-37 threonylcarbamoyl transferase component Bud32
MNVERRRQIAEVYRVARRQEPGHVRVFLSEACGADEELRSEVEALLNQPLCDALTASPNEALSAAQAGEAFAAARGRFQPANIGHYRVLRLLGEGGMGAVYEAEQENPRRIVALKVIKPRLVSPELLRRFEHEARALGRLQHPGIAQIYEAGTAETGFAPQPYFAMEFISGRSLLEYAGQQQLNARERLDLMVRICEAVHHAHQRGLIHRDLKPGNILVDETGQPKILDFGVARATDSDARATRQTDLGQLVGTLAYMSPEQALGHPLELDTRSDVYALGVILYELLAGRMPYRIGQRLHEVVQAIKEEEPAPLSSIDRIYRGDVETIVAKALEKDKTRRYASAADLGADIQRYLRDEPIVARPASTVYQLQKFARRHRGLVTGVAAIFMVLAAGVVVSTREAVRANRAQQTAQSEAATAKAVNDFLQNDLLAQAGASVQSGPGTTPDPDLKVRTALDRAAAQVAGKFGGQPLVEASIRQTIGETYEDLGLFPEAQGQFERAIALRRRMLGVHSDTLHSEGSLAAVYQLEGKWAEAEALSTKTLEAQRRLLGEEHPTTLATMRDLGLVKRLQGKYAEADALLTRVLDINRRLLGEANQATLESMNNLGMVYRNEGKYPQAEQLFVRLLELEPRVIGDQHPLTLTTAGELAALYRLQGRYSQAEPLCARVLEVRRRVSGEEHPETLIAMNNLALVYLYEGKYGQAEPLLTRYLEIERRTRGEEYHDTLSGMNNLALLYLRQGRYPEAEALWTRVVNIRRRVSGEEHPYTLVSISSLGVLFRYQGKYAEAGALLTKVLEVRRRVLGEDHPDTLGTMASLADLYQSQGKSAEAEEVFTKVLNVRRRTLGSDNPATTTILDALGRMMLKQRRFVDAEPLLREALGGQEKKSPDSWERYDSQSMLGASLAGEGKYVEAEPLLLSGYEGLLQRKATIPSYNRVTMKEVGERIIQLYQHWNRPEKAAAWREKLRAGLTTASVRP